MTAVDPELERHRRTWIGFTWFVKISLLTVVIILILMALFLLCSGLSVRLRQGPAKRPTGPVEMPGPCSGGGMRSVKGD